MNRNGNMQLPKSLDISVLDFFIYPITLGPIAASAEATGNIQIQTDANFIIQALTFFATANNAVVTDPIATIMVTDTGSGRNLFQNALPITSVCGTAQRPYYLTMPRLLSAGTSLQVSIEVQVAANAITFDIALHGHKLYSFQG